MDLTHIYCSKYNDTDAHGMDNDEANTVLDDSNLQPVHLRTTAPRSR